MRRSLLWTHYLGITTPGIALGIVGALMPAIRIEIPMLGTQAGLVLAGQMLGGVIAAPVGGFLADRYGKKPWLLAAGVALVAGFAGFSASTSFPSLFASTVLIGFGGGGYEIGLNGLLADHTERAQGKAMNLLHFFNGIGAFAGPLVATAVLKTVFGWRSAYLALLFLPVATSASLLLHRIPRKLRPATATSSAAPSPGAGSAGLVILLGALAMLELGTEVSTLNWIPTYWDQVPGNDWLPPSLMGSVLWLCLLAGRLTLGRLVDRVGLLRFVAGAAACAVTVAVLWTAFPTAPVTLAATVLLGLSLAGVFPTLIALGTASFPAGSGKAVGLVLACGTVGAFAATATAGGLAEAHGLLQTFPPFVATLAVLLLAGTLVAMGISRGTAPAAEEASQPQ